MIRRFSDRRHQAVQGPRRGARATFLIMLCPVLLALAGGASDSTAWADDGDEQATAEELKYSKANRRGKDLYERKQWKAARKQFQRAYDIIPKPHQLFNIGSTYRSEGNYIKALFYYHRYLAEAPDDAPYRQFARTAITELDAKIAAQKAEARRQQKAEEERDRGEKARRERERKARESNTEAPTPSGDPPNRGLQVTGAILVVAGIASIAFGGFEAYNSQKIAAELDDQQDGTEWTPELQARFDSGEAAAQRAVIFGASGGAAVLVGTILYVVGQGDSTSSGTGSESLSVSPYSGNDSVGVIVRGSF